MRGPGPGAHPARPGLAPASPPPPLSSSHLFSLFSGPSGNPLIPSQGKQVNEQTKSHVSGTPRCTREGAVACSDTSLSRQTSGGTARRRARPWGSGCGVQLLPSLLIAESPWRGLFQASQSRDSPAPGQSGRGRGAWKVGTAAEGSGEELAGAHGAAAAPQSRRPHPASDTHVGEREGFYAARTV